ncbi:MAG: pyridoxal-phosphate dependent enzyme [candidate division Zixibacteria bacterium]|nr:pyridoxal-phosphate dependent enzyme [candidate division Zixibacteria bacterium]NIS47616.1 pyridoxal-phosphate dependent enzyme [candidate division Zixibacteria bacterium]NIU15705.1 pyridoxal-phosphate dependent enzyme [candidate division Zixibacteria bacterium]NIV07863.1 pyridoxal-phosphate dependent enzyme [candidate division Zixibacteria bacterium]NIW50215.1 pyridoxal-phosphate dependent enzyme [Gammaproteobacteria bacterium]
MTEGDTLAEGIRIKHPHRGDAVLRMAENTQGAFVVVDEDQIQDGMERLYRLGFFVEPTSAVVWHGLNQVIGHIPEPIIVILTGSGYKNS